MRAELYDSLRSRTPYSLRRWIKRRPWFVPVTRALFGNRVYSAGYYADVERIERESVGPIAEWIVARFRPRRLIDVGCGPGHLAAEFLRRGVEVLGVDVTDAARDACRVKGVPCESFDLTVPEAELPGVPYDVAVCCEVAEHLEERHAVRFVEHLCAASRVVYLTAAEPDAGLGPGLFHVNEQPHAYWIRLFEERGHAFDRSATEEAREVLRAWGVIEYLARPLVFRKR